MPAWNKRILVIDDDPGILRAMEKVLASEGAIVRTARGIPQASAVLNSNDWSPDLLITDLEMPVRVQITLQTLRMASPNAPLIVITALSGPEIRSECLAAGAAAFLEKPVDTAQLMAAIATALNQGQENINGANAYRPATQASPATHDTFNQNSVNSANPIPNQCK